MSPAVYVLQQDSRGITGLSGTGGTWFLYDVSYYGTNIFLPDIQVPFSLPFTALSAVRCPFAVLPPSFSPPFTALSAVRRPFARPFARPVTAVLPAGCTPGNDLRAGRDGFRAVLAEPGGDLLRAGWVSAIAAYAASYGLSSRRMALITSGCGDRSRIKHRDIIIAFVALSGVVCNIVVSPPTSHPQRCVFVCVCLCVCVQHRLSVHAV